MDTTFTFDEELGAGYFVLAPSAFLCLPREFYTPDAKVAYLVLCCHAAKKTTCFPGMATLAEEVGCSLNTLRIALRSLVSAGLLTIKKRGQGMTNLYHLHRFDSNLRKKTMPIPETQNSTFKKRNSERSGNAKEIVELESVELEKVCVDTDTDKPTGSKVDLADDDTERDDILAMMTTEAPKDEEVRPTLPKTPSARAKSPQEEERVYPAFKALCEAFHMGKFGPPLKRFDLQHFEKYQNQYNELWGRGYTPEQVRVATNTMTRGGKGSGQFSSIALVTPVALCTHIDSFLPSAQSGPEQAGKARIRQFSKEDEI